MDMYINMYDMLLYVTKFQTHVAKSYISKILPHIWNRHNRSNYEMYTLATHNTSQFHIVQYKDEY